MPFSHDRFDNQVRDIIAESGCNSWLDIGAGAGKFGKMIKSILPESHVTGIEINMDYINKFSLLDKYDYVRPIDAMKLMQQPTQIYDGIILGDVLEHLPKSQGVDLVNFLIYRCKIMIVIYPIERIQNGYKDYKHEAHISAWGDSDWNNFDCIMVDDPASQLLVLDGYIEHEGIDIKCLQTT